MKIKFLMSNINGYKCVHSTCNSNVAYSMQFQIMDVQTYFMYSLGKFE
jgi:hypothetical protein